MEEVIYQQLLDNLNAGLLLGIIISIIVILFKYKGQNKKQ